MLYQIGNKLGFTNDILVQYLVDNIDDNCTVLDLGCGPKLYSNPLTHKCKKVVGIDAWENVNPDICVNLETTSLHAVIEEKFDYILMLDFIEHLEKAAGQRLIEECKQLVTKKIFLLTPLEEIWTSNEENVNNETYWCHGNKFDLHKSIWSAEEFKEWNTVSLDTLENYYFGYFSK